MHKFFRNLIISAVVLICGLALYQIKQAVTAYSVSGVVTSVSSGYLGYSGTSFEIYYVGLNSAGLVACGPNLDNIYAYLSDSTDSGNVIGKPSTGGSGCNAPMPGRTGLINVGTTYENFTGSTLYLHVFVKDSTNTTTKGYGVQEIIFVASGSGGGFPGRDVIYGQIGTMLSGEGIINNFNLVNSGNVSNFSGLYFAKMSGSTELGRITFYTGLDLTDAGTQNFLSGELPNAIGMEAGQIRFNPGTGFEGKAAELEMNIPDFRAPYLDDMDANDFYVREGSGGALTGNSMISGVTSGGACDVGPFGCSILLDVGHFTMFGVKPILTDVTIRSSAGTGAWSGDTIYLSFTGSEALTGVTVTIAGNTVNLQGGGTTRYASGILVTGGTVGVDIPFIINFSDYFGNSGNTVTTATSGSVKYYVAGPNRNTIYSDIDSSLTPSGIANNMDTINNGNVSIFTGLYFAKMSGSDELGRITFPGALNLTDSGVQTLLQNLGSGNVMDMYNGYIKFSPGAITAMNTGAQITMSLPPSFDSAATAMLSGHAEYFDVNSATGDDIDPVGLLTNILGACSAMPPYPCTIQFTTQHFTEFTLKPFLTAVHIQSNNVNTSMAKVNNIVTLTFTGSVPLTGVQATINGTTATVTGGGVSRTAYSTISTGTSGQLIPFTINYLDTNGLSGNTVTGTTDSSSITFYQSVLGGGLTLQPSTYTTTGIITVNLRVDEPAAYTISGGTNTITGTIPSTGTAQISLTGEGLKTIQVQYNTGGTYSTRYTQTITLDTIKPTATGSFSTTTPTTGTVTVTLTGWNETLTGVNEYSHLFTGNGSFTFTFSDLAGNTGSYIANVTNIQAPITGGMTLESNTTMTGYASANTPFTIHASVSRPARYIVTGDITQGVISGAITSTGNISATLTAGDGTKRIYIQYSSGGIYSETYSGSVIYDTTAPTPTAILSPYSGQHITDGIIILQASVDSGIGMVGYVFYIYSGGTLMTGGTPQSSTTINLSSLPDGTYITNNVYSHDGLGFMSPAATNITFTINRSTPTATGSYSTTSQTNQNVTVTLTGWNETLTGVNTGSHVFTSNGSFTFTFSDLAGNTGSYTATVSNIDKTVPTATVTYSPATLTNGSVTATLTGYSESLTGITPTNIVFTGNGTGTFTFSDLAGNTGNATATVTRIDKTAPTVTITSHTNNQQVTGSSITLAGTASDTNEISSVVVNGSTAAGTTSRSKTGTLVGGTNAFTITGTDGAGNTTATGITIIRTNYLSNLITPIILSGTSVQIGFSTDISAQGFTNYGTSSGSLTTNVVGSTTTGHTITINGLTNNTTYYYQAYAINGGYTGNISSINSFKTPAIVSTTTIDGTVTATGSVTISGSTSTGATFGSTGTLVVYGSATTDSITLPVEGLIITAGSSWNGILQGPTSTTFGGTTPSYSSYTHQPSLTYQIGNSSTSLTLSGQVVTITIYVGTTYNGKIMRIYKSTDAGATYTFVNTCTVSVGNCSFTSDGFSVYTMMSQDSTSGGGGGGGGSSATTYGTGDTTTTGTISRGSGNIEGSTYPDEWNFAYLYAYDLGITTMKTVQQANMQGNLIRAHMAKMMVNYAIKVLNKYPDTSLACEFDDIASQPTELKNYIKRACQLGLMGQGITHFDPNGEVTRAQFGTVLSRALYNNQHDGGTPYYTNHLNALKTNGIITSIDPTLKEVRAYVMLMLMRADK